MHPEAKVNILLVDDSRNNLLALEAILDSIEHNLVKATSGEEALRCILAQDFAVILLDVKMPGMDGFETAKLIRQRPASQHTPIIFITGNYRDYSDLERGYSLGAVDYLFKPIIPEVLLAKVAVFVSLFQKNAQSKFQAAQLKIANEKLETEIAKRKLAEESLHQVNQELERKVCERTRDLAKLNESLRAEILERKLAEEALRISEEAQFAWEAEKELRRLQLRFFSMASHEFRTPLSIIIGSAQLLKSCLSLGTEEKILRNLERIEVAAKNLTQLLDSLLTINRAETGKLDFNPSQVDLEKICIELVEEMHIKYGSKHQIIFDSQGQSPRRCLDEKLLRYILSNLLLNAIKYSPEGGKIYLNLTCGHFETLFQIKDEGIGIYPEDQQHLFELFHRGVNVENISGTGLGLSVVKKCVDLQGGTIAVESEVGVGTTVTVTIPKSC